MASNQQIIDQIAAILKEARLADKSGTVFCSGCETLKKGDVYFLGKNPGGSPTEISKTTVKRLYEYKDSPCNAYLDEVWAGPKPGQSLLQRRARYLFEELELCLRRACASNMVFVRPKALEELGFSWSKAADLCWPVHQLILAHVRPRMVLVYGTDAMNYIQGKMRVVAAERHASRSAREVKWFGCARGSLPLGDGDVLKSVSLLSVPHMSRFKINARHAHGDKHDTREALEWLRERKEEALG